FALLPRPFYNAHLDCFDLPIAFWITVVIYCYWRSLTSIGWAVMTGIAYGCALATKHNAWFVPGLCLIHFAWASRFELYRRWGEKPKWWFWLVPWAALSFFGRVRKSKTKGILLAPWWLLSMAIFGPLI